MEENSVSRIDKVTQRLNSSEATESQKIVIKQMQKESSAAILKFILIGGVLLLLGVFLFSQYKKLNSPIYLLNGYGREINVKIDDEKYTIPAKSHLKVNIAEGTHKYTIDNSHIIDREFKFNNTVYERIFGAKTNFLNLGGKAAVNVYEIPYVLNDYVEFDSSELMNRYYNSEFISYKGTIHFLFTTPSDEVEIYDDFETRTAATLYFPKSFNDQVSLMYYGETHDEDYTYIDEFKNLAELYLDLPVENSLEYQLKSFMTEKKYLSFIDELKDKYPTNVSIHRLYQNMTALNDLDKTLETYKNLLDTDSDNPDYIYLYSRVVDMKDNGFAEVEKIKSAYEKHPDKLYLQYYLARYSMDIKDSEGIIKYFGQIAQNNFLQSDFQYEIELGYLATGQVDKYLEYKKSRLYESQLDLSLVDDIMRVYSAQGMRDEAYAYTAELITMFEPELGPITREYIMSRFGINFGESLYIYRVDLDDPDIMDTDLYTHFYFHALNQDLDSIKSLFTDVPYIADGYTLFQASYIAIEKGDFAIAESYASRAAEMFGMDSTFVKSSSAENLAAIRGARPYPETEAAVLFYDYLRFGNSAYLDRFNELSYPGGFTFTIAKKLGY